MALKLILLDMDGTIVQYDTGSFQSSWGAVSYAAGKKAEYDLAAAKYYPLAQENGTYTEWFKDNCQMLKGVDVKIVEAQIFPPPYAPGFLNFCHYAKSKDLQLGMVSAGLGLVARRIQQEAGLDFIVANEMDISDGKFTGRGTIHVDLSSKGKLVKQIISMRGFNEREAAYVGDHENDIPAWREVGWPLGMNLKTSACSHYVIQQFDDFHALQKYLQQKGI